MQKRKFAKRCLIKPIYCSQALNPSPSQLTRCFSNYSCLVFAQALYLGQEQHSSSSLAKGNLQMRGTLCKCSHNRRQMSLGVVNSGFLPSRQTTRHIKLICFKDAAFALISPTPWQWIQSRESCVPSFESCAAISACHHHLDC